MTMQLYKGNSRKREGKNRSPRYPEKDKQNFFIRERGKRGRKIHCASGKKKKEERNKSSIARFFHEWRKAARRRQGERREAVPSVRGKKKEGAWPRRSEKQEMKRKEKEGRGDGRTSAFTGGQKKKKKMTSMLR